jgi:hypothetical protein
VTVSEAAERLSGTVATCAGLCVSREVTGGYASDLLSDVMANSREGDLWVTMQKHVNIVAVAQLNSLAAIVLVNGRRPDDATVARAEAEQIPIISTELQAFDAVGILYSLGIRGRRSA